MPINNVGYRAWVGETRGALSRCLTIATTGVRISFKNQWIRRLLFFSWLPVIYIGTGLFIFEKFMDDQLRKSLQMLEGPAHIEAKQLDELKGLLKQVQHDSRQHEAPQIIVPGELREFLRAFPRSDVVVKSIMSGDTGAARHSAWCWLLMVFFRYFQGLAMLVMIGLIVPPLISRDLRSRAYLMYFSRPIGRIEYLLGKVAIPATFLAMISLIPATAIYAFGVMLSPGFSVVLDTWDIPVRALVASAVLIIPTSLLALMFSALTYESRFAAFAWFAAWGLGEGAYRAITLAQFDPHRLPTGEVASSSHMDWSFLSMFGSVGRVQEWVFGMEANSGAVLPFLLVLATITAISSFILFRRVTAPINA